MSCYHPLKGFRIGINPNGKPMYKVTGYDVKFVKKNAKNIWLNCYEWNKEDRFNTEQIVTDFIDIPCGKCIGCLLKRSSDWATRCVLEAKSHDHNCFITLTYNDEHLPPKREIVNDLTGEISESPYRSLQKEDFQKFMKRLRKRLDKKGIKIRYFACGEYGDFTEKTGRPHYHAILFGYDFPDRVYWKTNFRGEKYFLSKELSETWSDSYGNSMGHVCVTDISYDTCAYVARYCLKKQDNNLSLFYDFYNLDKEFTLMSRRPGIGRDFYDINKNLIYDQDRLILFDNKGSKIVRPP